MLEVLVRIAAAEHEREDGFDERQLAVLIADFPFRLVLLGEETVTVGVGAERVAVGGGAGAVSA